MPNLLGLLSDASGNLFKNPEYGLRPDGSSKGLGYFGELSRPDGGVMTEYSIGVNIGGKDMDIPTIVPTLSKNQLEMLLRLGDSDKMPDEIVNKAVAFAKQRLASGLPVSAQPQDRFASQPAFIKMMANQPTSAYGTEKNRAPFFPSLLYGD